jgi:predicted ATPase
VDAVAEQVELKAAGVMRLGCSPFHQDSPLYPFIAELEVSAGIEPGDDPDERYRKLAALLAAGGDAGDLMLETLTDLIAIPALSSGAGEAESPVRRRERIQEALVGRICRLAQDRPLLLVAEDLHWADATTLDTLRAVIRAVPRHKILLIMTARPGSQDMGAAVNTVQLESLSRRQRLRMVQGIPGAADLPLGVVAAIAERADGIPFSLRNCAGPWWKPIAQSGLSSADSSQSPGLPGPPTRSFVEWPHRCTDSRHPGPTLGALPRRRRKRPS